MVKNRFDNGFECVYSRLSGMFQRLVFMKGLVKVKVVARRRKPLWPQLRLLNCRPPGNEPPVECIIRKAFQRQAYPLAPSLYLASRVVLVYF